MDSLDHVSTGGSLPRLGLVTEGWDPGAEPAVVRVIVTALLFGFFEQPCSVSSQGLVPSRNIILRENEELDDDAHEDFIKINIINKTIHNEWGIVQNFELLIKNVNVKIHGRSQD